MKKTISVLSIVFLLFAFIGLQNAQSQPLCPLPGQVTCSARKWHLGTSRRSWYVCALYTASACMHIWVQLSVG